MTVPLRCPSCEADLDAGPGLPFGELSAARQSRVIAACGRNMHGRIVWAVWRCPDCSHEWDR